MNMRKRHYQHLYGMREQFVKLEGRQHWHILNDSQWQTPVHEAFSFTQEPLFAFDSHPLDIPADPDKLLVFSEEARAIERKRLEALALEEIAQNIRAAQDEYNLQKLIESIDHYLKQDDLYQ